MVSFRLLRQGGYRCAVHYLDRDEFVVLPESSAMGGHCMWSPDSKWLAYVQNDKLAKIQLDGGKPIEIAPLRAGSAPFCSWSNRGILMGSSGITLYSPDGGGTSKVIIPAVGSASFPRYLPDGTRFLYCSQRQIRMGSVDEPGPPSGPTYGDCQLATKITQLADGATRSLFLRGETLVSQTVDPVTLAPLDEPTVEAPSVEPSGNVSNASMSPRNVLAFRAATEEKEALTWYTRTGEVAGRLRDDTNYLSLQISPDGNQVLTMSGNPNSPQLASIDLARDVRTPIGPGANGYPRSVWAPDSDRFVYRESQSVSSGARVLERRLSRSDAGKPIDGLPPDAQPQSWSPDGRWLLFYANTDLWLYEFEAKKTRLFAGGPGFQLAGQFSRDGKWIAYVEAVGTSQQRVFVQNVENDKRWQVAEGRQPRWGVRDREILFIKASGELMAAPFSKDGPGAPKELFRMPPLPMSLSSCDYDIHPDGNRILVAAPVSGAVHNPPITVIVNAMSGRR